MWCERRRWSLYLVGERGLYARFPTHTWPEHALAIVMGRTERPKRLYDVFHSYLHFIDYFEKCNVASFFEVIRGDQPQKPHFDIDVDLWTIKAEDLEGTKPHILGQSAETCHALNKDIADRAAHALLAALVQLIPGLDVPHDVVFCSSPDPVKVSYHLILDHWCCANNIEAAELYRRCMELVPSEFHSPIIDHSVYAPNQLFRLFGCTKAGKRNIKGPDDLLGRHIDDIDLSDEDEGTAFRVRFAAALVGNCGGCRQVPGIETSAGELLRHKREARAAKRGLKTENGEAGPFSPEKLREVADLVSAWGGVRFEIAYEVRDSDRADGRIDLLRLAPTPCELCSRRRGRAVRHEGENPFLTVSDKGGVWFYCRRAVDDGKPIGQHVGTLGIEPYRFEAPAPEPAHESAAEPVAESPINRGENVKSPPRASTLPKLGKSTIVLNKPKPKVVEVRGLGARLPPRNSAAAWT